jgi:hypothetical protein
MIRQYPVTYHMTEIYCDNCQMVISWPYYEPEHFIDCLKADGWRKVRIGNEVKHYCKHCKTPLEA